ncbi:MAG TPA: xanthine dehydrogenase family protein molybdopterin-binding subunit [Xanthobacteraceae bacterium]|nr:xanthine dehydrogenase family protein molybdopterin-binding subunit [Xanthobacteraceae bacterium]
MTDDRVDSHPPSVVRPASSGNGIGQPVRRKEDLRLVTGRGRYGDDFVLPRMAHAAFVRSPHAHARVGAANTEAALAVPGALAVLTGADYVADGLKPIPHDAGLMRPPDLSVRVRGPGPIATPHWPLPLDKARFVGEPVAMVVAESIPAARDMAERVAVDYAPLPAVARASDATKPGAPQLWDEAPGNLCIDIEAGDAAGTDAAFARAAHVVRLDTWVQRVTGVPLEPRTTIADYEDGRYTLYSGTGRGVVKARHDLARALGVPADDVRVLCEEMGGNFGTRNFFYPEWALLTWAARRIGRPIKWTCERSEAFLSDYQGRDLEVEAELALDKDGKFLAVRGAHLSNLGAYAAAFVSLQKGMGLLSGVYHIPVAYVRGRGAVTNTVPTTPYRSAGRPEVIFAIERLIDLAADRLGVDPAKLRRRNMIPPKAQPYANPLGLTYDSGRYAEAMERALALGDWRGFRARRAEARRRGKRRGIGVANYVEVTSGWPRERAEITVRPDRTVELVMGTMASGQGHETSFAQLVTEWLGVPFESIGYVAHDTARVHAGGGSHSGRSMKLAATVVGKATDAIIDKGRKIAGVLLEAGEADLEFVQGRYRVIGTDREVGLFEVAAAAAGADVPAELQGPLAGISDETVPVASFPYGTQVCEVEVDAETGGVEIVAFAAVDDVGRAVNPMILHGQTHGGIAQGAGQALFEDAHYDPASGQLLAGSFMDYAMPRADDFPAFATALSEVPSPTNRLGVRSGGEGGTTPALAAVVNAIVDALADLGVTHIEMPATPERVWRAIREARESLQSGRPPRR